MVLGQPVKAICNKVLYADKTHMHSHHRDETYSESMWHRVVQLAETAYIKDDYKQAH